MTDRTVNTILDNRRFAVTFYGEEPIRIAERKLHHAGHPWLEGWHNAPYWHAKHHKLGGPNTLPVLIIARAQKELNR